MKVEIEIPDNVVEFLKAFPIGDIQSYLRRSVLNDIGANLNSLYAINGLLFDMDDIVKKYRLDEVPEFRNYLEKEHVEKPKKEESEPRKTAVTCGDCGYKFTVWKRDLGIIDCPKCTSKRLKEEGS